MATSGIDWVHAIFHGAVHALVGLAQLLGISYEEINVWLFCVAWPLVTMALFLGLIILWRDNRALRNQLQG